MTGSAVRAHRLATADDDVWDRVYALSREGDDAASPQAADARVDALRASVDGGRAELVVVVDGPKLLAVGVLPVPGNDEDGPVVMVKRSASYALSLIALAASAVPTVTAVPRQRQDDGRAGARRPAGRSGAGRPRLGSLA